MTSADTHTVTLEALKALGMGDGVSMGLVLDLITLGCREDVLEFIETHMITEISPKLYKVSEDESFQIKRMFRVAARWSGPELDQDAHVIWHAVWHDDLLVRTEDKRWIVARVDQSVESMDIYPDRMGCGEIVDICWTLREVKTTRPPRHIPCTD